MPLFGPPNVESLKAKGDVKGLIRALHYQKDSVVLMAAAEALKELGWKPDFAAFKEVLEKGYNETANLFMELGGVIDVNVPVSVRFSTKYVLEHDYRNADVDFRVATMILLGLDPWWHQDTQERLDLVQRARESVVPKGEKLTEILVKVLTKDRDPESRAQAAIALGILNADFEVFEARGLMDRPLLSYKRKLTGQSAADKSLSLNDFRLLRNDPVRGEKVDTCVVEALRQALDDVDTVSLNLYYKSYPCLDPHIGLLASASQLRTMTGKLRPGERGEGFAFLYYRVGSAAALSLVIIGDKESMRHIVEVGSRRSGSGYETAGFFKLAYDLGWNITAVELAKTYLQNREASSVWKRGFDSREWALGCLSTMDDLETLIAALKDEDKYALEAAAEELEKRGWKAG